MRGRATEAVAADNPYAAILVSMHTLNLLTEQADLTRLSPDDLTLHRTFVERQRERQLALLETVSKEASREGALLADQLDRAFRFLQACDSLSLTTCVRFAKPIALRHRHPRRDGSSTALECQPLGQDVYRIHPYPFQGDALTFHIPFRRVPKQKFSSEPALRATYASAPQEFVSVKLVRDASAPIATRSAHG